MLSPTIRHAERCVCMHDAAPCSPAYLPRFSSSCWFTENVTDSVFACKLRATAMIFTFGVQFHAEQRLLVWRPRGALNEESVTDVVATLNQLEMELHEPFNRFSDAAAVEKVDLNYEYVISVALYRRFAYVHRPPIKSANSND